ncbi:MAG: exodeoxyribonuclease III [Gammaproteobacteria bacterium]|nr:exodeoxyribonuclease III [Gammaproteobacteria bacterium]
MRVVTWNVNSLRVRFEHLARWLADHPADVIALQELKLPDPEFPREPIAALGLESVHFGQRTYNGVALLARQPLADVQRGIPGWDDPERRVLAATAGDLRIVDVYVPNGQVVGSEKFAYKLEWLGRLRDYLAGEIARHPRLVVLGDFNIAPADCDVHDPARWEGSVHVSPAERQALGAITALGFADVFRRFPQPLDAWSWWDYRMNSFRRNHGLRIDLILATTALAERCTACRIDRLPRGWERPSDHAPVIADFAD